MQKLGVRGSYFCSSVSFSKTRQTFDTYRPNKDVKFRPFVKMPSPNELNKLPKSFWMCHKKASLEHPEIDTSYIRKITIYLNDIKTKILL